MCACLRVCAREREVVSAQGRCWLALRVLDIVFRCLRQGAHGAKGKDNCEGKQSKGQVWSDKPDKAHAHPSEQGGRFQRPRAEPKRRSPQPERLGH